LTGDDDLVTDSRTVGSDQFRDALRPTVEAARALTKAVDEVGCRHGNVAWDGSPAMSEIAGERSYASRTDWEQPIADAQTMAAMALSAASDYVRTYVEAFTSDQPPLYGHLMLARGALEAATVSSWLSEPGIGTLERIKRALCEQVYSATEVSRLPLGEDSAERKKRPDVWVARASDLGWKVTDYDGKSWNRKRRGKPEVDGVRRPPVHEGIARLVLNDSDSQRLGKLLWGRLSAVTHVTWFGLQSAFLAYEGETGLSGLTSVPVGTDQASVSLHAFFLMRALRGTAAAHFRMMGWSDDDWSAAARKAEEQELVLVRLYEAGLTRGER
jgi:hypothetical protein